MKQTTIFIVVLLITTGLFILGQNEDGLKLLQKAVLTFLELWHEFVNKDVVGIV